jgi:acetyl-CoA carboxylase carboxyl transferase subunit alpha
VICTVIGEGAPAARWPSASANRTLMLEYGTYSVISPEGCASILWKSADRAKDAAEQLGITAKRLQALGLIDKVVREPIGGAHRNPRQMATRLKAVLLGELDRLQDLPIARTGRQALPAPARLRSLRGGVSAARAAFFISRSRRSCR